MSSIRVLIVDDSSSLRKMICHCIETSGFILFEAGDGAEADRILQEQSILEKPIDIMILDWMMPKVSGFALLKKIRETRGFLKQPEVIMLTAETYPEQINACIQFGVSKYLVKPFTCEQIRDALENILKDPERRHAV